MKGKMKEERKIWKVERRKGKREKGERKKMKKKERYRKENGRKEKIKKDIIKCRGERERARARRKEGQGVGGKNIMISKKASLISWSRYIIILLFVQSIVQKYALLLSSRNQRSNRIWKSGPICDY